MVDLSLFGMAFECPQPLRVGERCFLELRHDRHAVSVEVAIRWCATPHGVDDGAGGRRSSFRIGACFVDILRDDRDSGIWRWIEVDPHQQS